MRTRMLILAFLGIIQADGFPVDWNEQPIGRITMPFRIKEIKVNAIDGKTIERTEATGIVKRSTAQSRADKLNRKCEPLPTHQVLASGKEETSEPFITAYVVEEIK